MIQSKEHLLVIDADSRSSGWLVEHFAAQGFEVTAAATPESCAEMPANQRPDVIIGDLMPEGVAWLTDFLEPFEPRPPVVVLTNPISTDHILETLRAGAADVVSKVALDIIALDEALARQLERVRLFKQSKRYRQDLERTVSEFKYNLDELRADQRAGRQVQMKMLPEKGLRFGKISIDHCIKPSLYLSGDFFDYYHIDQHRVGFYFADVSGHGASSAFVTVLLKNLSNRLQRNIRRQSSDDILHPERLLARVNSELLETDLGKHLTMFAGIIDTEKRMLTYSVGAHYPMPVFCDGKDCSFLEGRGAPVGLMAQAHYKTFERPLPPGFSIIIVSDGLFEVLDAPSLDAKEALMLERVRSSGHTIGELESVFQLDALSEIPDDIAIVSITETLV